ncbi:hypothetical protein TKWG_25040 [Advenella kashmirensis WT001]|uniref:Uncharacterized protein n=1 Tax=Advenella kashmirensis (strain DSM 17095 / LMG 22695 / WT001) TaxID=1036672 RepID=I3UHR5_ADVKW|nr:hypothetical protein TKWG_25040 [Advenella kashmirensis WT001]
MPDALACATYTMAQVVQKRHQSRGWARSPVIEQGRQQQTRKQKGTDDGGRREDGSLLQDRQGC